LATVVTATGNGREIEEAEVHRLLHLVDELAGQEHIRYVGLDQFHLVHWVRIGRGLQQA
jgi:hypothetical protein